MSRKPYTNPSVETAVRAMESKFGRAYDQLQVYLERELAKLNRDGQVLVRDQANIQAIQKLTQELQAKARALGYGDILKEQRAQLLSLSRAILDESGGMGLADEFSQVSGESIKALLRGSHSTLLADETRVARELEDMLIRSATGNVKWMDLVNNMSKRLEITQRQAMTKAADVLSSFHTQTRVAHFEDVGIEWFLYDGPRDTRTRRFCSHFVGTKVTVDILNKHSASYGRNHPLPPQISLGGYNCRHELVPIAENAKRYKTGPR